MDKMNNLAIAKILKNRKYDITLNPATGATETFLFPVGGGRIRIINCENPLHQTV